MFCFALKQYDTCLWRWLLVGSSTPVRGFGPCQHFPALLADSGGAVIPGSRGRYHCWKRLRCYILPVYILTKFIYHIMSHHITSYHIISYHITSHHIVSYHIISYHIRENPRGWVKYWAESVLALSLARREIGCPPYTLLSSSRKPPDDNVENMVFLHFNQGLCNIIMVIIALAPLSLLSISTFFFYGG